MPAWLPHHGPFWSRRLVDGDRLIAGQPTGAPCPSPSLRFRYVFGAPFLRPSWASAWTNDRIRPANNRTIKIRLLGQIMAFPPSDCAKPFVYLYEFWNGEF
jgi:hypothetical protein